MVDLDPDDTREYAAAANTEEVYRSAVKQISDGQVTRRQKRLDLGVEGDRLHSALLQKAPSAARPAPTFPVTPLETHTITSPAPLPTQPSRMTSDPTMSAKGY